MDKNSQTAEQIIAICKKKSCDVQITCVERESKKIKVREGDIENLLTSISISTGIRIFKGKKSIIMSFSGETPADITERIHSAIGDIQYLEDDDAKRLLTEKEINTEPENIICSDQSFQSLEVPVIVNQLKTIEKKACDLSPKIKPAESASFSGSHSKYHLFSSLGLSKSHQETQYVYSYQALAQENNLKEVDYYYEAKRNFEDLRNLDSIGVTAAEKVLKKLGGKKIKSGEKKAIFVPETASFLLSTIFSALNGESIVTKSSFLTDKLNTQVFPKNINVVDNPLINHLFGSYPFDGEGLNSRRKTVIENGKLLTYLHNSYTAAKLNMELTGNASLSTAGRPHITSGNFYLEEAANTFDDLLTEMQDGIIVKDMFTSGMNRVTGDFSFGCSGFLVEKGIITQPVKEVTIAGNILEIYNKILAIGNDTEWKDDITSPSLLVSSISLAGI